MYKLPYSDDTVDEFSCCYNMGDVDVRVLFWELSASGGDGCLVQVEAKEENINPPWSRAVLSAGQWVMYTGVPTNSPNWLSCIDNPSWRVSKGSVNSEEVWELILGQERDSSKADVTADDPGST